MPRPERTGKRGHLTPTEAAFFSTILPSPKLRYSQYCAGTLTNWTDDKIHRILKIMLDRKRLTQEEYDERRRAIVGSL